MASLLQAEPQVAVADPDVEVRFRALAEQWRRDTQLTSSYDDLVFHPAYQQIIGMGRSAVPLLVRELKRRRAPWFWALFCILGENPVRDEDAGDFAAMRSTWLDFITRKYPQYL